MHFKLTTFVDTTKTTFEAPQIFPYTYNSLTSMKNTLNAVKTHNENVNNNAPSLESMDEENIEPIETNEQIENLEPEPSEEALDEIELNVKQNFGDNDGFENITIIPIGSRTNEVTSLGRDLKAASFLNDPLGLYIPPPTFTDNFPFVPFIEMGALREVDLSSSGGFSSFATSSNQLMVNIFELGATFGLDGPGGYILQGDQTTITSASLLQFGFDDPMGISTFYPMSFQAETTVDTSQAGKIILTTPEGNVFTLYTTSVTESMVDYVAGDLVYDFFNPVPHLEGYPDIEVFTIDGIEHPFLTKGLGFEVGDQIFVERIKLGLFDSDFDFDFNSVVVYIVDDLPYIFEFNDRTLDEANIQTIGTNQLIDPLVISGTFVDNFQAGFGADGGIVSNVTLIDVNGAPIMAGQITIDSANDVITVVTAEGNILEVQQTTGDYTYQLINSIDNDSRLGATDTQAIDRFEIEITDFDFDQVRAIFEITIIDDEPIVTISALATPETIVDETLLNIDATVSFANQFILNPGADGTASLVYNLGLNAGSSGLVDTISNTAVVLSMNMGIIYGRDGNGADVFTISINASNGDITLNQLRSVVHDDPADPDEANGPSVLMSNNLISLTVTLTDNDTDVDSATKNIGDAFRFEDDGPTIVVNNAVTPMLIVDETDAGSSQSNADFSVLFNTDFGADGFKDSDNNDVIDADAIVYALGIGANNVPSGLIDTLTNESVTLSMAGLDVVGSSASGGEVFRVSVNTNTGFVNLSLSRAVTHDDPADHDEANGPSILSAANLITLSALATDGDSDTSLDTKNIGDAFKFEDDGPSILVAINADPSLVVDETDFSSDDSASFINQFTVDFGSDGFKDSDNNNVEDADAVSYVFSIQSNNVNSGLVDVLTSEAVTLSVVGTNIIGSSVSGGEVFRISIDTNSGLITLDQSRAVVHNDPNNPNDSVGFTNDSLISVTATIIDGDLDFATAIKNIGGLFTFFDDAPNATRNTNSVDETALFVNGPGSQVVTGNLLTDDDGFGVDSFGNDGGALVAIDGILDNGIGDSNSTVGIITKATAYGTISVYTQDIGLNMIGDYTYTLLDATIAQDSLLIVDDIISYTLIDGDLDQSTEQLRVAVDLNQRPTANSDGFSVNENGILNVNAAGGLLANDTDPDAGDTMLVFSTDNSSTVGTFSVQPDGSLQYNPNGQFESLPAGITTIDTFTYSVVDAEGLISPPTTTSVTIVGQNDPATINVVTTDNGTVRDDGILLTSGQLSVSDVDMGENGFVPQTTTTAYGTFTMLSTGAWSFALNNSASIVQNLNDGDVIPQVFTVSSIDGTDTHNISVNVQGTDDAPIAVNNTRQGTSNAVLNLVLVLDTSGSMNDAPPGGGSQSRLEIMQDAVAGPGGIIDSYASLFSNSALNITVVEFAFIATTYSFSGASSPNDAKNLVNSLDAPGGLGGTNYNAPLNEVADNFFPSQNPADANIAYFISDGRPSTGLETTPTTLANWQSGLASQNVDAVVVNISSDGSIDADLAPIANPGDSPAVLSPQNDLSDLQDVLLTQAVEINGNVLNNDSAGAGASSITVQSYSLGALGLNLGTPEGATLILNSDGTFIYTATLGILQNGNISEQFTYTIVNDLGETDSAFLTFNLAGVAPIVFDLDNDGIELVSASESGVMLDIDGDGQEESVGWVGANDGILVIDMNNDQMINQIEEIAFSMHHEDATTDLEGLRLAYDANLDNVINMEDDVWSQLYVWQDSNQNATQEVGELLSLNDLGIESLSLQSDNNARISNGNIIHGDTYFTYTDGTTGLAQDVELRSYEVKISQNDVLSSDNDIVGLQPANDEPQSSHVTLDNAAATPSAPSVIEVAIQIDNIDIQW